MDWQQPAALGIVGVTAMLFLWRRFRPRKFDFRRDTHCGCSSPAQTSPQNSIVFRARKGARPVVEVKMR
jgi:hypothetical protein